MGFFMTVVRFFTSILISIGVLTTPFAEYTPLEQRAYTDGELEITPQTGKHLKMTAVDEGWDIYNPEQEIGYGYRYGPSMLINADGSIDAYFSAPGFNGEWDWITYRHSPDSGRTWTEEKAVLMPTGDSTDFYSCCDPGAFKMGDYYYIGYTSTVNKDGLENDVFVARSKTPDGPFEKWNGSGWGGRPKAIVEYTGDVTTYGAGEPSFVVLDDVLYIYYTWKDGPLNQTRVSVADATDENWPATMQYKGVGMTHRSGDFDSADVKYIDDYGLFIATITCYRFSTESAVGLYVSDDGLTFRESYLMKEKTSHCCHNCGITSRPNGHIRLSDGVYVAYAYGNVWANWPTRFQKVEFTVTDSENFDEGASTNIKTDVTHTPPKWYVNYIGFAPQSRVYETTTSALPFAPKFFKVTQGLRNCGFIRELP